MTYPSENYLPFQVAHDFNFVPATDLRSHKAHTSDATYTQRLVAFDIPCNIWYTYDRGKADDPK